MKRKILLLVFLGVVVFTWWFFTSKYCLLNIKCREDQPYIVKAQVVGKTNELITFDHLKPFALFDNTDVIVGLRDKKEAMLMKIVLSVF